MAVKGGADAEGLFDFYAEDSVLETRTCVGGIFINSQAEDCLLVVEPFES